MSNKSLPTLTVYLSLSSDRLGYNITVLGGPNGDQSMSSSIVGRPEVDAFRELDGAEFDQMTDLTVEHIEKLVKRLKIVFKDY